MNQGNREMTRLVVGVVVGVVLGLGLGLLFGYVIAPVEWTDGGPQDLRQDYAAYYWELVAESYSKHGDLELAKKQLGDWSNEEKRQAVLQYAYIESGPELRMVLESLEKKVVGSTTPMPTEEQPVEERGSSLLNVFAVLLLLVVFVAIVFYLITRLRKSRQPAQAPVEEEVPGWLATMQPEEAAQQTPPLGHFVTSYALGNDTYDESFSIESKAGEFLGECGVGISETIGVGDPDKVTAFEVWLFDKNDIRTVTKVLMSEHAFNDADLRARLATKGEAILARPNQPIALETATLRVDAMVTEAMYGAGSSLPVNSFFERLTVELVGRAKENQAGSSTGEGELNI
jgi:hypothetical protein